MGSALQDPFPPIMTHEQCHFGYATGASVVPHNIPAGTRSMRRSPLAQDGWREHQQLFDAALGGPFFYLHTCRGGVVHVYGYRLRV
jgi:hypothetical protein